MLTLISMTKVALKRAQRLTNGQSALRSIPNVFFLNLKSDDMTKLNLGGQEVTDKIHQPDNHTNSGPHQSPPLSQPPVPTIQVTIYGNGITGEDLEHYFRQYGEMVQTPTIQVCATNFACINYRTIESAIAACRISRFSLKGVTIMMKSSVQEKIIKSEKLELQAKHEALNSTTSGVSYPSEWEPQSDDIELKAVSHGSKEWSNVEADVKKSMPGVFLIKVERIQNKRLWEKYDFYKKIQLIKNDGIMNEMRLFHGTKTNPPEKIYRSEHGFDFRFGKFGMWGKGTYFAVDAIYSTHYAYKSASGRQIFMAYVLTGHSKKTHPDSKMVAPPIKEGEQRYDSVIGDAVTKYGTFHVYAVYDHDKSYPAYLITFSDFFSGIL